MDKMLYEKRDKYNNVIKNYQFNGTRFIFDYKCFYFIIGIIQIAYLLINYDRFNSLLIKIFLFDGLIVLIALTILIINRKKLREEANIELLERESERCKIDIRLRHQEIFEPENKKRLIEFEINNLKNIVDLLMSLSHIDFKSLKLLIKCLQNNFGTKGEEIKRRELSYRFFKLRENQKKRRR